MPPQRQRIRVQLASAIEPSLEVVIIAAGVANGLRFTPQVLAQAAPLFEGAPVFLDHATFKDMLRAGGRSVRDLVGLIVEPTWHPEAQEIRARLRLLRQEPWLEELVAQAGQHPRLLGLSADLWIQREEGGTTPHTVVRIEEVNSVDIVCRPAAGGRFLPPNDSQQEETMPKQTQLSEHDTRRQRVQTAVESPAAPPADEAEPREPAFAEREEVIELALQAAQLPEPLQRLVRQRAETGTLRELQETIASVKSAWAEAQAQKAVCNLGPIPRVTGMRTPLERIELAFERLMGLPTQGKHDRVARLSGIRELYDLLTGDWERHGVFRPDRVQFANVTSTTMAQVCANVLNKVMLRAYESRPHWWQPIAYEQDFTTMQDIRWITLGGFGDLSTVSEGDAYTELTWDDYAETSSFVKKGNYVGITLEMIDRDDVSAVRAIPRKLGLAAYRSLSAAVSDLFTANSGVGPTLADGKALFHTDHNNLGSAALDATAWNACVVAMFEQPEYHSGKALGVRPSFLLVPIELENTAIDLFTTTLEPGLAGNSRAIALKNHTVITVPEWTDPNNWAAAAHPDDLEGVCIGYRFSRAPELFVASDELNGAMFTNDELRIKVRSS